MRWLLLGFHDFRSKGSGFRENGGTVEAYVGFRMAPAFGILIKAPIPEKATESLKQKRNKPGNQLPKDPGGLDGNTEGGFRADENDLLIYLRLAL